MGWGFDSLNLTRVCPICGKKFIPEAGHVYRDKSQEHRPLVCTYHCMRESERRADKKREKTVRRYKRLDPAEMTDRQRRMQKNRESVKCSTCVHARRKETDGETMMLCEHPDREYIYQHKPIYKGQNRMGVIAVIREGDERPYLRTPVWCPLRKGDDEA